MAEFEVGVKMKNVTSYVKVPMQLEPYELELPSKSYEFLNEAAIDQIWTTVKDRPLRVHF